MPGVQSYFEIHSRSATEKTKKNKFASSLRATVLYKEESKVPNYTFTTWCVGKDRDTIIEFISPYDREENAKFHQKFEVICVYSKDHG